MAAAFVFTVGRRDLPALQETGDPGGNGSGTAGVFGVLRLGVAGRMQAEGLDDPDEI